MSPASHHEIPAENHYNASLPLHLTFFRSADLFYRCSPGQSCYSRIIMPLQYLLHFSTLQHWHHSLLYNLFQKLPRLQHLQLPENCVLRARCQQLNILQGQALPAF